MVSTKWIKGIENLEKCLEIRKKVFCDELNMDCKSISDIYDEFSFNVLLFEENKAVGTGRLLFKDGKYLIDKICVLKEFRGKAYGELIIRMLVRKTVTMNEEKSYAIIDTKYKSLFEKIGFNEISIDINGSSVMLKDGDVGGHCS